MASNRKVVVKTRTNSDPLTGEWHGGLERLARQGGVVMQVRDWNIARKDWPPTPTPTRLHRHEPDGRLGGCQFTPETQRYFKGTIVPTSPERQSYLERHWWVPAWAEAELRANWPADVVDIVLCVRRDHATWDDAMRGSERALGDVKAQMRQMQAHCQRLIQAEPRAA